MQNVVGRQRKTDSFLISTTDAKQVRDTSSGHAVHDDNDDVDGESSPDSKFQKILLGQLFLIQNVNLLRVMLLFEFKSMHQYQNNIPIHAAICLIVGLS